MIKSAKYRLRFNTINHTSPTQGLRVDEKNSKIYAAINTTTQTSIMEYGFDDQFPLSA